MGADLCFLRRQDVSLSNFGNYPALTGYSIQPIAID